MVERPRLGREGAEMTDTQALDKIYDMIHDTDIFSEELCKAAQRTVEIIEELSKDIADLKLELKRYEE